MYVPIFVCRSLTMGDTEIVEVQPTQMPRHSLSSISLKKIIVSVIG